MHPATSSATALPSRLSETASSASAAQAARELLERAFAELARGDVVAASACSRRARIYAGTSEDATLISLARCALAIEEAMRGDIAAAERHAEEIRRLGGFLRVTAAVVPALRARIAVARSRALLLRGARNLALDAWHEAEGALAVAEGAGATGLAAVVVEAARTAVREHDPRKVWLVGPKSFFVDTPDGTRVDLTKHPFPRRVWMTLLERHCGPNPIVTSAELASTLWPGMDPSSPTVRNRLKVTVWRARDLGLRNAIVQASGGYMLAPDVRILRWQPSDATVAESH